MTILVVDDEPGVRRLCATALKRAGYSTCEAANGQEALGALDREEAPIGLVITDIRMPVMGGIELVQELRTRRPAIKIICISGFGGDLPPHLEVNFLPKPFSRDDLLTLVRRVLEAT